MSSRAFRRLQNEDAIKLPSANEEEEEREDSLLTGQNNKINPFDLLTAEDDPLEEEGEEEGEREGEESVGMTTTRSQVSNKKKKKKKRKDKTTSNLVPPHDNDEVEIAIKEVTDLLGGLETSQNLTQDEQYKTPHSLMKPLLCIDRRYLNADNEMRRIFGSRVVRGEQSHRRRGHGRRALKQSVLATPKDTWPQMEKLGLSMILDESKNNCQYFKFNHNVDYQKVQFSFWNAVDSYDPNSIAAVLHTHPYHIDSLVQLSEVCKMGEDWQMAADLIERALYSFESVFHPLFNYTQDNCKLNYSLAENRSFFLVLFHHINYIGRRGCHRTAFEFCKMLLSLDSNSDPLCVLLLIDYYAIRAGEYQFMLDMEECWEVSKNLSQLPNCAFSTSLAYFHSSSQTEQLLHKADLKLQSSLIMFPSLLVPLLDKCGVHFDQSTKDHSYFTSPPKDPNALKLLISLYIERSYSLWKEPEVLSWLERNVKTVIQRVTDRDPLIETCNAKRQRCYVGTPRNVYRHIVLSDIESVRTELPREITVNPIVIYDPLPPEDSVRSYKRPERSRNQLEDDDSNPVTLFLRSLLPSFNMQQAPVANRRAAVGIPEPRGEEEGEEREGGGEGAVARTDRLEAAIVQLTDTVRQLLDQIRIAVNVQEEGGEGESEEELD